MQIKCEYCGTLNNETDRNCCSCGAPLPVNHRTSDTQPHTIVELKLWYEKMNLPPEEVTRCFIGKDIEVTRAFGIYKNNTGDFIVYKNKADGSRVVRYKGDDEAYAVNEVYQILEETLLNKKSRNNKGLFARPPLRGIFNNILFWGFLLLLAICMLGNFYDNHPHMGYYRYNNNDYYHTGHSWFIYDDYTDSWSKDYNIGDIITSENDDDYHIDADSHIGLTFADWSSHNSSFERDSLDNNRDSGDSWDLGGTNQSSDW